MPQVPENEILQHNSGPPMGSEQEASDFTKPKKTPPTTLTAGDREGVSSPEPSDPADSDYTEGDAGSEKARSERGPSKNRPRRSVTRKKSAAEQPLDMVKPEPDQHATDLENLRTEHEILVQEHNKNLKEAKADLNKKLNKEKHAKAVVKEDLREAKAHYEAQIRDLNLRLEEQETNIRNWQETISRLTKKAGPAVLPDNIVYSKLEMIESLWMPFAKKWALPSLSGLDPAINRHVIGIGAVNADLENIARLVRKFQRIPAAPSILLNTLVAHFIHKEIFDRPFFNLVPKIRECFESALDMIKKDGGVKVSHWRALSVRLYHAAMEPLSAHGQDAVTIVQISDKVYQDLATQFVNAEAKGLLAKIHPQRASERNGELVTILQEAGSFAIELFKQRTHIQSQAIIDNQVNFNIKSPYYKPHPHMHLDADDGDYDGWPIEFVVQQGLVAYGNKRGEKYDEYKIWLKSTALVIEAVPTSSTPIEEGPPIRPAPGDDNIVADVPGKNLLGHERIANSRADQQNQLENVKIEGGASKKRKISSEFSTSRNDSRKSEERSRPKQHGKSTPWNGKAGKQSDNQGFNEILNMAGQSKDTFEMKGPGAETSQREMTSKADESAGQLGPATQGGTVEDKTALGWSIALLTGI